MLFAFLRIFPTLLFVVLTIALSSMSRAETSCDSGAMPSVRMQVCPPLASR